MRIPDTEKYLALWAVCMGAVATLPGLAHYAAVGMVLGGAVCCFEIIEHRALYYRDPRKSFTDYIWWRYFPGEDR